jgi:hypothetical protein
MVRWTAVPEAYIVLTFLPLSKIGHPTLYDMCHICLLPIRTKGLRIVATRKDEKVLTQLQSDLFLYRGGKICHTLYVILGAYHHAKRYAAEPRQDLFFGKVW